MELIYEIIDQSGRAHDRRRFSGERFRIGRAFDNDLILSDPTVSPYHAVIEAGGDGRPVIRDLDSMNGVLVRRKQRLNGAAELVSGGEYTIGKTRVYVYTPDHPVAETVELGKTEHIIEFFDRPLVLALSLIAVTLAYGVQQWLNMFSGYEWQLMANTLLIVFGSTIATTLFWVVIGRVLKHEANFRKQLAIVLVFVIAQFLMASVFNIVMYNTLSYMTGMVFMVVLEFVLIAAMLWLNLYLATNQSSSQRWRTAMVVSLLMITLSLYSEITVRSEFSESPDYVRILRPPVFLAASAVDEDTFVTNAAAVFGRLDVEE
jgi:hypothetical protein